MKKQMVMLLTIVVLCSVQFIFAADWATWRGPNHNGITSETGWNPKAIENLNIRWSKNVGLGYASVCVANGKVYTMGNTDETDNIFCFDEQTGKEMWKHSYPCENVSFEGSRATPVFEKGKIYTVSQNGHVFCLDGEKGNVIWKRHLLAEYGTTNITWGIASSARIVGDLILLNVNKAGVALNKNTGKDVWKSETGAFSYATPMIYTMSGKKYAAIFSAKDLFGVEVESGKIAWKYHWETSWDINGSDPIFYDNKMFLSSGYKSGCALLDISNNKPKELWNNKNILAQFGSCVLIDGYIYGPKGNVGRRNSGLACIDAQTGKLQWEEILGFSSLIAIDNKLVVITETGNLHIAEVNPKEYKEIAQAKVIETSKKNPVWTAPVLSNKNIYIRNHQGDLICINVEN